MIEVKPPINPIIAYGDDAEVKEEIQKEVEEATIMLDNYFIDNNVGVHI